MKRFIKFVRVYWKGILLYAVIFAVAAFLLVFLYYGGTSFLSMEGFYRKNLLAQMGIYMLIFLFIGIVQGVFSAYIYMYFMMGGGMNKMLTGDSAEQAKTDVKWDDVIGMEDAKRDAWEIVQFIKDAKKVKAIGGTMIKGVLMVGPPGCGKTYLAKAIASECKLPFISAVGSEFVSMWMGMGAARMKAVFKKARQLAAVDGGCLIFIDEIDSFATPRVQDHGFGSGGQVSLNATINQFLTELDGLRKRENNIVVIAATNMPPEKMDDAIMRSGRFDRKIYIEKPTAKERADLLSFYIKKITTDNSINVPEIAEKAQWFSPADISNMVREASVLALRERRVATHDDMIKALNIVMNSIEKTGEDKILSAKVNVKWDDLVGMEETKRDAWEIVELLKERRKLGVVGGHVIKGVMLVGPPGCGKTYMAKAIATESGFPFLVATGSDFINKLYAGTGIAKMQSVFKEARNLAKAEGGCIIFIDEIDSFIRPRDPNPFADGQHASDATIINQFLTEIDGLKSETNNVVVLAATNVPEEKLDPAVMRSGRFDRKIYLQKPSARDRQLLLKYYLDKAKFDPAVDIATLADKAKGFTPADINNMVREASILARREKREALNQADLETALTRVMHSVEVSGENKILGGKVNVKWDEVIGMKDAKEEAWEIVKLLKDRNLLKAIGGKIVKGVLMIGPPGCGKTYLAKAMATESGFPFMSAMGSDLVGIYVGEGARKVKDIFKEARELAKAEGGCLIFFDEIDSFATPRGVDRGFGGMISHNATINQFLTELDGLRQQENNIVVLAATNVREDQLDAAILRAGRIERKIYISLPNLQEREELFKFYLSKVNREESVSPSVLARTAVGFTPSDIDNMIREAGLIAMRNNRDIITHKDLSEAYDRLTMGAVTNAKYTQTSIKNTAYHEAGHAILTFLVDPTDEVIKATVRPRKGALGYIYTRAIEELESNSPNREHLLSKIQMLMAGYVAEKVCLGTTGSGVGGGPGSDFHHAMTIASRMVWSLGMGPSGLVGDFDAMKDANGHHNISEKTREVLDSDVQNILQTCLKETNIILSRHKDLLEYFAQELMNKGDLEYDEIRQIFEKFGLEPAARIKTPEK